MSQGIQDALLLTLTAVAAIGGITGIWLVIWSWIDRPQHLWGFVLARDLHEDIRRLDRIDIREKTMDDKHKLGVRISAIGVWPAYDVTFRVHGCTVTGSARFKGRAQMTSASEPVELEIWIPENEGRAALLDILWLQHRPHRHRGQRIDLRTGGTTACWRWSYRSLRLRGWRLARTRGRWVERQKRDCPEIPDTDDAPAREKLPGAARRGAD